MTTKKGGAQKVGGEDAKAKKLGYFQKLTALVDEYPKVLIVEADNVGSNHMQKIRIQLRGQAVVLMGKNTMIRKALRGHLEKNPRLEELLPTVRGNVGFIFTKGDLASVKAKVVSLRVDAPAKVGVIAPNDVTVPAGPTGLEPTQTSFLQALNIPSKINKGQVEIINDFLLLKKGDKVGQSEAALLQKLSIRPFTYGLVVKSVFDEGMIYDAAVLDPTEKELLDRFATGVRNVAALGLQISFPTTAAVPHLLVNAYTNLLAIAAASDVTFKRAEKIKSFLSNPSAFASAGPPPAAAVKEEKKGGGGGEKAAAKKEEKKEPEPPAEEEADMGLSLFD